MLVRVGPIADRKYDSVLASTALTFLQSFFQVGQMSFHGSCIHGLRRTHAAVLSGAGERGGTLLAGQFFLQVVNLCLMHRQD